MNKKRFSFLIVCFIFGMIFSQGIFAEGPGYVLKWQNLDSKGYIDTGHNELVFGYIRNFSGKTIKNMKMNFLVMEEDGLPFGTVNFIMKDQNLKNGQFGSFALIYKQLEEMYDIKVGYLDFIYLSEIEYTDGSVWEDPGNLYFLSTIDPEFDEQYEILEKQIEDLHK